MVLDPAPCVRRTLAQTLQRSRPGTTQPDGVTRHSAAEDLESPRRAGCDLRTWSDLETIATKDFARADRRRARHRPLGAGAA